MKGKVKWRKWSERRVSFSSFIPYPFTSLLFFHLGFQGVPEGYSRCVRLVLCSFFVHFTRSFSSFLSLVNEERTQHINSLVSFLFVQFKPRFSSFIVFKLKRKGKKKKRSFHSLCCLLCLNERKTPFTSFHLFFFHLITTQHKKCNVMWEWNERSEWMSALLFLCLLFNCKGEWRTHELNKSKVKRMKRSFLTLHFLVLWWMKRNKERQTK